MPIKVKTAAQSKTFTDSRVVFIIRKRNSHKGVSRAAIIKSLAQVFDANPKSAVLNKALKKAVTAGILLQMKQSFKVAGDPEIEPPRDEIVQMKDVKDGSGEGCKNGQSLVVKYRGTLEETGEVFDSAQKFVFTLGQGEVIKGWEIGMLGMKIGAQRRLIVPSKLAYGQKGSGPKNAKGSIPTGANLCLFVTRLG